MLIAMLAASGCSGWFGGASDAEAGEGAALPPVALTVVTRAGSEAELDRLRAAMRAARDQVPGVSATLEVVTGTVALADALSSLVSPAIVVADGLLLPALLKEGQIAPWRAGSEFAADLPAALRAAFAPDGLLQCAPRDIAPLALVYDKGAFADAEVAAPTAEWTWDDLRTAAEALTELEQGEYGLVSGYDLTRWLPLFLQSGGELPGAEGALAALYTPEGQRAYEYFARLFIDGVAATPADVETSWAGDALGRGRAAMIVEGPWVAAWLDQSYPDVEWEAVPLPAGPTGEATLAFSTCYALNAGAADGAALAYAEALVSMEAIAAWADGSTLPARQNLLDGISSRRTELAPWVDAVVDAHVLRPGEGFIETVDAFSRVTAQVVEESLTPAEGLAEIDRLAREAALQK